MGDGNTSAGSTGMAVGAVGTAVNPHGGWKQGLPGLGSVRTTGLGRPLILMGDGNTSPWCVHLSMHHVGTAVNPHGGWKLFSPREGGEENRLGRPLILMGDGNKKFGYHEALPPRWDGR